MSFVIAHISDVHLPTPDVKWNQLFGKRITGYLNWKINRQQKYYSQALEDITNHIKKQKPDHIVVTGDLINLGLNSEITNAKKRFLVGLGNKKSVSVVPGNHDAYVRGAIKKVREEWQPYMSGDNQNQTQFPYVRDRGEVAIIGVNTGVATPPLIAAGRFDKEQAKGLESALEKTKGKFRVVLIHHPPYVIAPQKRLYGVRRFQDAIKKCGAELILHGHTHKNNVRFIESENGEVPVVGVAAAGQQSEDPPTYNLFAISKKNDKWMCEMKALEWNNKKISVVREVELSGES